MTHTIINPIGHGGAARSVEGAVGEWLPIIVILGVVYYGAKIAVSQVPAIEGALSTRIQGAAGPNILNGSPTGVPSGPTNPIGSTSIGTTITTLPGPNIPSSSVPACVSSAFAGSGAKSSYPDSSDASITDWANRVRLHCNDGSWVCQAGQCPEDRR